MTQLRNRQRQTKNAVSRFTATPKFKQTNKAERRARNVARLAKRYQESEN